MRSLHLCQSSSALRAFFNGAMMLAVVLTGRATDSQAWFARTWQTDEGLPQNNIAAITQTADGYLWLGTPAWLVNFDGAQFHSFPLTNTMYAGNRGVVAMLRARDGGLWVAMNRGAVAHFGDGGTKVVTAAEGLMDLQVRQLAEASDGTLWVLFRNGSYSRIRQERVLRADENQNLPDAPIDLLACDVHGNIWWTKGRDLGVCELDKCRSVAHARDVPTQLAPARKGGVWICAGTNLLCCDLAGKMDYVAGFGGPQNVGAVTALMEDSQGAVWVGTAYGGLFRYDGFKFETVPTSRPEIQCLFEDREQNIWAGTLGGGLNRIRRRVVQVQGIESGLPFESVRSLCEDTNGVLWATAENGLLARYANQAWQTVPSTGVNNFTCVAADPAGGIWISARSRRVFHEQGGEVSAAKTYGVMSEIFSMQAGADGDLWLGESGIGRGVQCLRNGDLINYNFPGSIRAVRAIARDPKGTIWFGAARGELLRVQGAEIVREPLPESDPTLSIRCLAPTADGALWIGYEGLGVGWLKDGAYHRVTTAQGLFDDYISQIVPDENGWLWFGSDHGIFKARQADFVALAAGKIQSLQSIHYGRDEGLENLQANFGYSPGSLRDHEGRLWMPMRSGLALVNPHLSQKPAAPLRVLLCGVKVDDRRVARYESIGGLEDADPQIKDLRGPPSSLKLPPDQRRLEIEFTTLSFVGLENIRFQYRMTGFEKEWRDAGDERQATYARLPAGDYIFEVKACNGEGIWGEPAPPLALTVLPHFWQTWWFIASISTLLLALAAGTARYVESVRARRQFAQLEREHAVERERARIAKDIHDDLGAHLTEIALLSELARSPGAPAQEIQEDVSCIAAKARQLTNSLDEIVWAVNPGNDTFDSFVTYTCLYAQDYLKLAGIRCRLKTPAALRDRPLPTNIRHNTFLVVKEALHNVVKHAGATEVVLSVAVGPSQFEVVVRDDGHGFDPAKNPAGGNGLTNMRQRLEDVRGTFNLVSAPGKETVITLLVPFSMD